MNGVQAVLEFIVYEGTLLALLFYGVALAVTLLQQGIGRKLNDALGRTSLETGAVLAATAGAVTPFCSCSTVPVLSGMLRSRVRFGVCFTFLIASPVINEGVLLVLLRQYSVSTAVVFLLVASMLSVAFGLLVDRAGMARYVRLEAQPDVDGATRIDSATVSRVPWPSRLRFASMAAWGELRASAPYLAVGIAIGALIFGYVPQDAIVALQQRYPGIVLIFVLALVGVPFYVNSTMVVPIALALLEKGLSIGPVTAFLVSSAGTSIPEMIMLSRLFKAPLLVSHVVTIVASATVIGIALEWAAHFL
ncbi:permease [Azohydromonas aeria]|uniref:permease n=1 Tax=Azohydromonas aeria TaxID=2590212 RepID=UPI0012FB936D|nr:permease [Azohydromonas aeria]